MPNRQQMTEQAFGRYRLLERLGEGGMAEVFKAKSFGVEGFEKTLVIKRILPKLAVQPRFVDMFVHEAKLAVRLSHANIVQVFDLGRVDHPGGEATSYYMAMEYVAGLDLATLLQRYRKRKEEVPFALAVFLCAEIAKALDHAHRRRDEQARPLGVVHRDISPQNILISWEGEVKVTDFGIAKAKDSLDEADASVGRVRGKLAYMSPEQSRGEPLDGRSDLFSLGVVLYDLITLTNPFAAPTAFETLRRVQASEFPPLELLRPDVPKPLADICTKLLAKLPADRFADAGALHDALLAYFYATGDRFGANKLAELIEPLCDAQAPEIASAAVFEDEPSVANDRTPVEVPSAATKGSTGSTVARQQRLTPTPAGGVSIPARAAAEIGERREVTALVMVFADDGRKPISATSEPPPKSSPGLSAAVCAQRARDVVARYGALLVEEEPSSLAAIFGLGDPDGRDTEAAVRAALVALRACGGAMSAGIHAARIVIDASGAPVRDERLASLLSATQALARVAEGRVAVSPLAARIVRSAFSVEEPTGDRGGSGALFVSAAPSAATVYGRFIGRVDELKRLGDILASATRRRGQLVVVQGDKGIGKSRVVAEMDRRLAKGNYNVGFYVAACPRNGAGVPWSGLRAMLGVLCGVQEGDDEQRILDVLPRLRALGLQLDESSVVLAQLGAATPDLPAQAPQEVAAILRSAFARMVQSLADDRLHVLAWDDAHAMDPQTLDLLLATLTRFHGRSGETGAASSGAGLRTVFLLATRENPPEALTQGVAAWEGNARAPLFHRITLQELGEEDCARLLASRVGARILGPELVAFCRERAGGHPLFLEELVKELVDSGAVSVQNGLVKARLEGATTVPRTLRTLIAGRVSRLDPEARALLAAAAILGDPLSTRVLGALLSASTAHVDRVIAGLVARDLLRVIGPEQIAFASPMHEEIVLDSVPPEARRELHAAAAAARIEITGEGNEQAERIAHHLHEAGDRDRSATWYARAAQAKLRARQIEPAIRFFGRALDLCDLDARAADDLSDWLHQLAGAATRSRVAPDFVHLATRALRRVDDTGSLDQQVLSRVDAAMACGAINEFDDANRWLEEAYMLADVRGELRLRALSVETEMAARAGDFARAKRAADEAAAMGPITSGRLLLNLAHALAAAGSIEPAIAALDRAEALDAPEDLEAATDRAKARVLVYIYGRDAAKGLDASRHAVELARATGLRFPLASCLHNLGDAARRVGDFPRAHAALSESRDVALASGNERLATLNRMHLAYLDGVTGEAGAVSLLREFLRYAESRSYWTDALECRLLLGQLLVRRGSLDEARVELERLLELASVRGNHLIVDDARDALRDCEAASK